MSRGEKRNEGWRTNRCKMMGVRGRRWKKGRRKLLVNQEKKKKQTAQRTKTDAVKAKGNKVCYLGEGPRATLDAELRVAELTVASVGGRQPLLQAAPVHRAQGSCAVAGGQKTLAAASFMTNTADGTITVAKWEKTDRTK